MELISQMPWVNLFDSSKSCQSELNWRSGRQLRRFHIRGGGSWKNLEISRFDQNLMMGRLPLSNLARQLSLWTKTLGPKLHRIGMMTILNNSCHFLVLANLFLDAGIASRGTILWCISQKWKYIKYSSINRFFVDWWTNDTCTISPTSGFVKALGSPQVKKLLSGAELDRQLSPSKGNI